MAVATTMRRSKLPTSIHRETGKVLFQKALTTAATDGYFDSLPPYQFRVNDPKLPMLNVFSHIYERYRVNSLKFKYVSTVAATQAGKVLLAFVKDPVSRERELPFDLGVMTSKEVLSEFSANNISDGNYLSMPPDSTQFYCRESSTGYGTDTDDRFCSPGLFLFGYTGITGATSLGYFECYYDITFENLNPLPIAPSVFSKGSGDNDTFSFVKPFGDELTMLSGDYVDVDFSYDGEKFMVHEPGVYLMEMTSQFIVALASMTGSNPGFSLHHGMNFNSVTAFGMPSLEEIAADYPTDIVTLTGGDTASWQVTLASRWIFRVNHMNAEQAAGTSLYPFITGANVPVEAVTTVMGLKFTITSIPDIDEFASLTRKKGKRRPIVVDEKKCETTSTSTSVSLDELEYTSIASVSRPSSAGIRSTRTLKK